MKKTYFVLRKQREIPVIQTNEFGLDARILFEGGKKNLRTVPDKIWNYHQLCNIEDFQFSNLKIDND